MALELYELKILIFLLLNGPSKKTGLVRALGLNWSRLSKLLDKLMEKGLVHRVLTFSDRPTYVYLVTAKGVEELERIFLELKESLERAEKKKYANTE